MGIKASSGLGAATWVGCAMMVILATVIVTMDYDKRVYLAKEANQHATPAKEGAVSGGARATDGVTNRAPMDWRAIESNDYQVYVAKLRAAGCPEATVEDIIIADVNAYSNGKAMPILTELKQAIIGSYLAPSHTNDMDALRGSVDARLDNLNHERMAIIQKILAHDVSIEKLSLVPWSYLLTQIKTDDFPYIKDEEKKKRVRETMRLIQNDIKAIIGKGVTLDSKTARQLDEVYKAHYNELKASLAPDEYETLVLNQSPAASRVKQKFAQIGMSSDQYRSLVFSTADYFDKYGCNFLQIGASPETADEMKAKKADDDAYNAKLKNIIGESGYNDMLMYNDSRYNDVKQFAQENEGLSPANARELYDARIAAENQVARLELTDGISDQEKSDKISQILNAAQTRINAALGQEIGAKYLNSASSDWMSIIRKNGEPQTFGSATVVLPGPKDGN